MIIAFLFHSVLWQGDSEFALESIIGDGNGVDRDLFRNVDSDGITLNDSQGVCSGIFWKLIEFVFVWGACVPDISYNVICDACILGLDPDIDIVPIGIVR